MESKEKYPDDFTYCPEGHWYKYHNIGNFPHPDRCPTHDPENWASQSEEAQQTMGNWFAPRAPESHEKPPPSTK